MIWEAFSEDSLMFAVYYLLSERFLREHRIISNIFFSNIGSSTFIVLIIKAMIKSNSTLIFLLSCNFSKLLLYRGNEFVPFSKLKRENYFS